MIELMNEIFHVFSRGKLPGDDTLLEKYIDWLRNYMSDKETCSAFLKKTQFVHVLQEYVSDQVDHPSPQLCAFLMKVSLWIGACGTWLDEGNHQNALVLVQSLVRKSKADGQWRHAAVRHAFLYGLTVICQKNQNLRLFVDKTELYHVVMETINDSSLFVVTAAAGLLVAMTVQEIQASGSPVTNTSAQLQRLFMDRLEELTCEANGSNGGNLLVFLDVCVRVSQASDNCCQLLTLQWDVPHRLLRMLATGCVCEDQACLGKTMEFFSICHRYLSPDFWTEIEAAPSKLIKGGRFYSAVYVAHWLLTKLTNIDKSQEDNLIEIANLPVNLVLERPVTDMEVELNLTKTRLKRLLLLQLSLMTYNTEGYSPAEVKDLLLLLEACSPTASVVLSRATNTVVAGNKKIKYACLDGLRRQLQSEGKMPTPYREDLIRWCVGQLQSSDATGFVDVSKCLDCLLLCVVHKVEGCSLQDSSNGDEGNTHPQPLHSLLSNLKDILTRLLCHIQWEIRDCVLDFMAKLLEIKFESAAFNQLLSDSGLLGDVMHCVGDGESYVRASALKALHAGVGNPHRAHVIKDQFSQEVLFDRITSILHSDTEAFARRAAVAALQQFHRHGWLSAFPTEVCREMQLASADLDWEVKLVAVDFWATQIDHVIKDTPTVTKQQEEDEKLPSYAVGLCDTTGHTVDNCNSILTSQAAVLEAWQNLRETGCIAVLLDLVHDWDKAVQVKVCTILQSLRKWFQKCSVVNTNGALSGSPNANASSAVLNPSAVQNHDMNFGKAPTKGKQREAMTSDNPAETLELVSETLTEVTAKEKQSEIMTDEITTETLSSEKPAETLVHDTSWELLSNKCQTETPHDEYKAWRSDVLLQRLLALDLDTVLAEARRSTDQYADNPRSLLQDILASVTDSATEYRGEEFEDNAVDCY